MKRLYRKVLRELREYLVEKLTFSDESFRELCSVLSLDSYEIAILEQERCNADKLNRLIVSLSSKKDESYETFKEFVQQTKNHNVYDVLKETEESFRIDTCETALESSQLYADKSNTDENKSTVHHYHQHTHVYLGDQNVQIGDHNVIEVNRPKTDINSLLQTHFKANQSDAFVSLNEIKLVLLSDVSSRINLELIEDILEDDFCTNAVTLVFPDAKLGTRSANRSKKKKKKKKSRNNSQQLECGFFGISSNVPVDEEYTCSRERQESESSQSSDVDSIEDINIETEVTSLNLEKSEDIEMSIEHFYQWIKEVLENFCKNTSAAERFKNDCIDGSVFNEMTEDELKTYLPILGQRRKVQQMWKQYKTTKILTTDEGQGQGNTPRGEKHYQCLREFDCQVTYKHKYSKGTFIKETESRKGNPLSPVHKYVDIKGIDSQKEADKVSEEIVKFGSACMNEKVNGTIHFGIKLRSGENEIIGCQVSTKMLERTITKCIRQYFDDGQTSIALCCIRPPQYIEVLTEDNPSAKSYVVEVDVVPTAQLVEKFAYFLKPTDEDEAQCILYRFDGNVKQLNPRQVEIFMNREKDKLYDLRQEFEKQKYSGVNDNKNQILQDFLCCGGKHLEQSIFPLLILANHLRCNVENLEFAKYIKWRAIFDFSVNTTENTVQQYFETQYGMVFNTNFIEDFDPRYRDGKIQQQTEENLKMTALPNWIYCNGSAGSSIQEPSQWKVKRLGLFRKAFEFYLDNSPPGRERILIPLFGKDDKLLIEAAEEIFIKCQTNCLVVAESETVSCYLRDNLQRRNVFPPTVNVENIFLDGLPWNQVNEAVRRFCHQQTYDEGLEIPRSSGVSVIMKKNQVRQLCDIDILGINQCCELAKMNDEEKEKEIERNKEKFYRGGMPTWENFYSSDQILVRDVHTDLIEHVNSALSSSGRGNQATKQVVIYHQPGAGGSTTSRQILWNMKEKYRCCVVKSVTKQTTEQINQLRHYGEESQIKARPVLVLVDLDEEDTTARFCEDMIAEGQRHCSDIHSVLLICRRVSELPTKRAAGLQVFLGQHLSDREQNWFKTTSKTLIERHKNKRGCDPNTLLSFNIMKENFNPDAIANQVAMYVRDPGLTEDHRLLLKYIAFLNFFDLNFKPIPMHCFDPVFSNLQWVNSIPPSFRVLVNTTDINGMCGVIPCMRIANYLLSRPVLDAVLNYEEELGKFGFTIGEVAEELLHSKIICPYSTREYEKIFEKILGNIIKKRGFIESREKPNQFCPLITEILEKKDFDTAVDIVEKIYEITDDPMVAQQLARLHTEFHNWEKALDSIRKAIEQMPNHSYLTHTCGQIYKLRFDIFCKENRNKFGERQIEEALIIAQHAYFYFQESQKISRTDNVFPQNPAGFDGEIRLGIDILRVLHPPEAIKLCEKQSHVERYAKTERLNGQRLGCMCQFLKGLPDSVFSAIQTLEADIHSTENLTDGFNLQCDHFFTILAGGQLDSYKDEFEKLLYRSVNNNPSAEKSIRSLIDASKASDEILQIVLYNMRESLGCLKVDKIRIFLASALELLLRKVTLTVCSPDDLLNLSRTFYEQNASTNPTCKLEAHMMITTFHWPLESKKKIRTKLCPHSLFLGALQSWQKIVSKRPSKPNSADKPMFYLSKSSSFPFVVKADQVSRNNAFVFKGSVCPGGNEIDITPYAFHTENAAPIKISVLHTVRLSSLWNKSTDVVIGIGLHGPKAELLVNLSCNQMRDEVSVKQKTKTKDDKRFSRQSGLLPRPVNYTGNANYHRFGSAEQYHFAQQQYPLPPDTPYMMYPQVNPWRYPPVPQGLQGGANSQRQSYMGGYAPRSRRQ